MDPQSILLLLTHAALSGIMASNRGNSASAEANAKLAVDMAKLTWLELNSVEGFSWPSPNETSADIERTEQELAGNAPATEVSNP